MTYEIHNMDCRVAMSLLMAPDSVDSIVSDPPYGLSKEPDAAEVLRHWLNGDDYTHTGNGFMGRSWDSFVPGPSVWREAYRVLKPGGYLLAFFGTRTYDLGVMAIRLAGFEIRDEIAWLYGSGFPKSLDVGEGRGTALKPAHEPIVVARKPFRGTVAQNVQTYGTGAINIDVCRVPHDGVNGSWGAGKRPGGFGNVGAEKGSSEPCGARHDSGRFPANVIHDGSDEVLAAFPSAPGQIATASTSDTFRNGQNTYGAMRRPSLGASPRDDSGSAARFFKVCQLNDEDIETARICYVAKASKRDRSEGLDTIPVTTGDGRAVAADNAFQRGKTERQNPHPTVKPTDLMRYLTRLVTPPGGTVLDPFAGSGSTGKAAILEGFNFIGCELDADYVRIAEARCAHASLTDSLPAALNT